MHFDAISFITTIEFRLALWDTSSDEYANRDLKEKCWEEVTNMFGGEGMGPREKKDLRLELQKRWRGLKSCYARELKRQKSIRNGSRGGRKSEYIYFKQLQFLQRVKNITDEINDTAEKDPIADRLEKQRAAKRKSTVLNRSVETSERRDNNENDEDRLFLLSLLSSLQDVPRERKMVTKIRLMSVLQEAVEGKTMKSDSI